MMSSRNLRSIFPVGALALCVAVSTAFAQPSDRTSELIELLDAPSWIERDLASLELALLDEQITLADIELYLTDTTLSPDQRARLMDACIMRYITHPKGGLGVAFGNVQIGAIEVQPIQNDPRFPASAMLNPGDAISRIDGTIIESQAQLRAQILSREPGDTLPASVIRAGEIIELDLPLGAFGQLSGAARLEPVVARMALELRWARMGIVIPPHDTIGTQISEDQWLSAAFPQAYSPDARIPSRGLVTALISGAHQLVETGRTTVPRRYRVWTLPGAMKHDLQEYATFRARKELRELESKRILYTIEKSTAESKLEAAAPDPASSEDAAMNELIQHTDELILQLDQRADQLRRFIQKTAIEG